MAGADLRIVGVKLGDARKFASKVDQAWRRFLVGQVDNGRDELESLAEILRRLERPKRYPSARLLEPYRVRASDVLAGLPPEVPDGALLREKRDILDLIKGFQKSPDQPRASAIKACISSELAEMRDFFDGIASNPLTPEQPVAVAMDEVATLVVAGPGSGKTDVIVAKTAYLIRRGVREPGKILFMAFGKDAAAEMASRIKEPVGEAVNGPRDPRRTGGRHLSQVAAIWAAGVRRAFRPAPL